MGFFICTKTTALKNYANNLSALLLKKRQRRRGNNNFGLMFFNKKMKSPRRADAAIIDVVLETDNVLTRIISHWWSN